MSNTRSDWRAMSLRGALLALLSAEPMSGYDLDRILDETHGYYWTAPHSQIYLTLRQLESEGLVEAEVKRTGARERRVYRVLDKGLEQLLQWASEPISYNGERDTAHLKASLMNLLELDECEAIFRAHLNHYRQRLVIWESRIEAIESGQSPILRARLKNTPPHEQAKLIAFKICGYEGSAMRARSEIEWAERGLDTVASLRRAEAAEPSNRSLNVDRPISRHVPSPTSRNRTEK